MSLSILFLINFEKFFVFLSVNAYLSIKENNIWSRKISEAISRSMCNFIWRK